MLFICWENLLSPYIPYSIILYITFFQNFWRPQASRILKLLYITQHYFPFSKKMLFICRENLLFPYNPLFYNFVYNIFSKFLGPQGVRLFKLLYITQYFPPFPQNNVIFLLRESSLSLYPFLYNSVYNIFKISDTEGVRHFTDVIYLSTSSPFPQKMLFFCWENLLSPFMGV